VIAPDLAAPDVAGFIAVDFVVVTYFLSQIGRMDAGRPLYPALNAAGAALILISLYFRPNPASIVIETFWLAISLVGLVRALSMRRRADQSALAPRERPSARASRVARARPSSPS
jgi:hypothetical protein